MNCTQTPSAYEDEFEFVDDIHGPIHLNALERDVVDSPEFQRLFRLGQLGFVDLVYPTANHTRGAHSIGAAYWAKRLVLALQENHHKLGANRKFPKISRAEAVLISLGALTHDLPHGPYSHDIEKKTHQIFPSGDPERPLKIKSHYGPYDKHDDFLINPALFVFLMDPKRSVLARVLRKHSPRFRAVLEHDAQRSEHSHLAAFVRVLPRWSNADEELLPSLLFHILSYEKTKDAWEYSLPLIREFDGLKSEWGLGPEGLRKELHEAWYQPFRHDIIGDTLSADLLDYLMRDQSRLGMKNEVDLKLLNYYVMVTDPNAVKGRYQIKRENFAADLEQSPRYTCAIDLHDHKRGTFRAERLNDIFRLLDIRHQIHEKAVYHRVVQSAIAMLSRTGLILSNEGLPQPKELYGLGTNGNTALSGDEMFLARLVEAWDARRPGESHQSIACKLAERRVYRPLMVIPGDRVPTLLSGRYDSAKSEYVLREIAALLDSKFYSSYFLIVSALIEALLKHSIPSEAGIDEYIGQLLAQPQELVRISESVVPRGVIFWTTPYKQLYKDPAILVCADENVTARIDDLQKTEGVSPPLRKRVEAGIHDAEAKNEAMWKMYVFLSDGLFYAGGCARLLPEHPCRMKASEHTACLAAARNVVVRAIRNAWEYWLAKDKDVLLEQSAPMEELTFLLRTFVGHRDMFNLQRNKIVDKVSAVKVAQYVHGDDQAGNCRDVRYKFDGNLSFDDILAEHAKTDHAVIRDVVHRLGLKIDEIPSEELTEIVIRLSRRNETLAQLPSASLERRGQLIRDLWLGDLAIRVEQQPMPTTGGQIRLRPVNVGRMVQFSEVCKIMLAKDFSKHEAGLMQMFEPRVMRLQDHQFAGAIAEFARSARASAMSEERRAEGPENDAVYVLESFLQKLFDKAEGN